MGALLTVFLFAFAADTEPQPLKTTLCEIVKQPARFAGKRVEFRATIDSGVQDLPTGVVDPSCAATLAFGLTGDAQLARLANDKQFRKMSKALQRTPRVQATVIGWFERKPAAAALILESVRDVTFQLPPKKKSR